MNWHSFMGSGWNTGQIGPLWEYVPHTWHVILETDDKMSDDDDTIDLVEEHVVVSKRLQVTGGVRVHTVVHTDEKIVTTPITTEEIEVDRVPLDRWVDEPIPERQEGDTRIITLHSEVVVTMTRLKATEEIRLTRRSHTHDASERVTLRRTEAVLEHLPASAAGNDQPS